MKDQGRRGKALLLQSQHCWIGGWVVTPCLSHFIPRREPHVSTRANQDGCRKYSSPPGFHPQTILKSHYNQLHCPRTQPHTGISYYRQKSVTNPEVIHFERTTHCPQRLLLL